RRAARRLRCRRRREGMGDGRAIQTGVLVAADDGANGAAGTRLRWRQPEDAGCPRQGIAQAAVPEIEVVAAGPHDEAGGYPVGLVVLLVLSLGALFVPLLASSTGSDATPARAITTNAATTTTAVRPATTPALTMGWPCPDSPIPGLEGFGHWYCAPSSRWGFRQGASPGHQGSKSLVLTPSWIYRVRL